MATDGTPGDGGFSRAARAPSPSAAQGPQGLLAALRPLPSSVPVGLGWWLVSARDIATLKRSCRSNCLTRRCRLLMAAPACSP